MSLFGDLVSAWSKQGVALSESHQDSWTGGTPSGGIYCLSTLNNVVNGESFQNDFSGQIYLVDSSGERRHVAFFRQASVATDSTFRSPADLPLGKSCIPVRITGGDDSKLEVWVVYDHKLLVTRDDLPVAFDPAAKSRTDHIGLHYVLKH